MKPALSRVSTIAVVGIFLVSAPLRAEAPAVAPHQAASAVAPHQAASGADAGRVVTVVGEAVIGKRRLAVGDTVHAGERIETARNASVKLLMPDRTIIDISPASAFVVEEFKPKSGGDRDVTLNIDFGRVRASVNRKLEGGGHIQLRTKSSVLAVRGTEFIVTSPRDGSAPQQVVVVDGRVQISAMLANAAPVFVTPGHQWQAVSPTASGSAHWEGQLRPIDGPALAALATAARAEDTTFLHAIVVQASDNHNGARAGQNTMQVLLPAALTPLAPNPPAKPGAPPAPGESPPPPPGAAPPPAPGVGFGQDPGTQTGLSTISNGMLPPPPPSYIAPRSINVRIH